MRLPKTEAAPAIASARAEPNASARKAPLQGTRVLDLTNVLSGPFCAYQLGQLGAEVIKVEMPGTGDLARQLGADENLNSRLMGASFLAQNGGKKSVTLNLKHDDGRAVLHRLVQSANKPVKVLGRGEIAKKLTVRAHKFSGKAAEKIAAAGGAAESLERD